MSRHWGGLRCDDRAPGHVFLWSVVMVVMGNDDGSDGMEEKQRLCPCLRDVRGFSGLLQLLYHATVASIVINRIFERRGTTVNPTQKG